AKLDTIGDNEKIKFELWKVVYGVWDYIKNSGNFSDVENLTLEWVGLIPGKRESRRFNGLYKINKNDIVRQHKFDDAVAFGGWAIDLHPADGVYSDLPGCLQYHSKGIYSIPYRCMMSKDIDNLFLAGRIISATHIAFGSTRVMATSAFSAQAVGMASAICLEKGLMPAQVLENGLIVELQQRLNVAGQSIPFVPINGAHNLATKSSISASSSNKLDCIRFNGGWKDLTFSMAQLLPLRKNIRYSFEVMVRASETTKLSVSLRRAKKRQNYTPDLIVSSKEIELKKGEELIRIEFDAVFPEDQYGFICFEANDSVAVRVSEDRITGVVSVFQKYNKSVAKSASQTPPEGIEVDAFDFWVPERRPEGYNVAMNIVPAIDASRPENVINGYLRPFISVNAWIADLKDLNPTLSFVWDKKISISEIILYFDTDYDHSMESVQMGHPERIMPFCVRNYVLKNDAGDIVYRKQGNYTTINSIKFDKALITSTLSIEVENPSENIPAAIFQVIVR
ncbi:MAG: FAD-dependent oxidoreductase, partial [Bacteroidales bacterium]|nr:FAD-dependent oxidoreductase [Bacteroidales bacterium]